LAATPRQGSSRQLAGSFAKASTFAKATADKTAWQEVRAPVSLRLLKNFSTSVLNPIQIESKIKTFDALVLRIKLCQVCLYFF
jgi:hypothetical protein